MRFTLPPTFFLNCVKEEPSRRVAAMTGSLASPAVLLRSWAPANWVKLRFILCPVPSILSEIFGFVVEAFLGNMVLAGSKSNSFIDFLPLVFTNATMN